MSDTTLELAKQVGDNPSKYSMDQLHGALTRLTKAKQKSRHSAKAMIEMLHRLDSIEDELLRRIAR